MVNGRWGHQNMAIDETHKDKPKDRRRCTNEEIKVPYIGIIFNLKKRFLLNS